MWITLATLALARPDTDLPPSELLTDDEVPTRRVIVKPEVRDEPTLKNGLSFGLSAGLATGFGPTLGIPTGGWGRVQITGLPVVIRGRLSGSGGVRFVQFLGKNPRSRLYVVEGAALHGWADAGSLWAAGVGMGVETRRDWTSGRTGWFDVTVTALGTSGSDHAIVLPLPQAGIAWIF